MDHPDSERPTPEELAAEARRLGTDQADKAEMRAVREDLDAVAADWPADATLVMAVDKQIAVLGELIRTLVVDGRAHLATAASWIAEPDDALDGQSPASWLAAGRDPDRLRVICRQDAARLAQ